jgi:vacuolar-type H+-ATPase subunit F/Vma7
MAAKALIFSLAESLFKTNEDLFPTPQSSLSSVSTVNSSASDEILHTLLDKFLLTLSPTPDPNSASEDKTPLQQIQSEIFHSKDKYFNLLKFFLQRISRQSAQQNQLSNLPWKALLNKKSNFLQLFFHKSNEKTIANLLCLLRNCHLSHLKDLCCALLSVSQHSPSQELNDTILHLLSTRLRHESSSSSLVPIACLQSYLLVSQSQLSPSPAQLPPLMLLHSQRSSFFTTLAFIAIWSTSFQLSADEQLCVLTKTQPLFQTMTRGLGNGSTEERETETTDPAALYLIRKWIHFHLASPLSRAVAVAQELLRSLGQIEYSYFKKDCPPLLLQLLSLPESSALLRWDGLLARDDIAILCRQSIVKLVASKGSQPQITGAAEEEEEEAQQLQQDDGEAAVEVSADEESEWRALLRGKKTLNTKEKKTAAVSDEESDREAQPEEAEEEEEIGFVLDTQGDQSVLEQEQQEEEQEVPPTVVTVPEKKSSRKKRKESKVVSESDPEEQAHGIEGGVEGESEEGTGTGRSTRRSKRTRK